MSLKDVKVQLAAMQEEYACLIIKLQRQSNIGGATVHQISIRPTILGQVYDLHKQKPTFTSNEI